MPEKKRKMQRFQRDVVVLAGGVALLVAAIVGYFASQVKRDVSEQYIFEAADRASREFEAVRTSVESTLGQIRDYGESGLASLSKPDELKKLLLPMFEKKGLLSGICIADEQGRSYFLQSGGSGRGVGEADGYDARSRPWFEPAMEMPGKIYWTEQYLLDMPRQVGASAAVAFDAPQKKQKMVVAVDVPLSDLYQRIRSMMPSAHSRVFVFQNEELLLLPGQGASASGFVPVDSVTNELVSSIHSLWGRRDRGSDSDVFPLRYHGKVWWCGFRPLENVRREIWVGIMVPESDIVGIAGQRRTLLLAFGFALLLVPAAGAFWLSRRYGRMIEAQMGRGVETQEDVLGLVADGENRRVEFKSTLRMNLHTGKPGKEIELAWLKGVAAFLNTDGGTLLLGVTDDGEITGIERDVFENEDKCRLHFKNLIATHIGAEKSKYIRFRLVPVEGKTVGVVQCARSSEPVFLKNGNKEAFYIRNGPSSDELPVSKALHYIKHRKRR